MLNGVPYFVTQPYLDLKLPDGVYQFLVPERAIGGRLHEGIYFPSPESGSVTLQGAHVQLRIEFRFESFPIPRVPNPDLG